MNSKKHRKSHTKSASIGNNVVEVALPAKRRDGESDDAWRSRMTLTPSVQAALTVSSYGKGFGDLDICALAAELSQQCAKVNEGDLKQAEALLTAQAQTLDAIFHEMARKALRAEFVGNFDVLMRLALKAQGQSRATLETLAAIKNPTPVAFVRQANIANGPQQVNNAAMPVGTRAAKTEITPNELSRVTNEEGQRLDFGASTSASATHSAMATMDAIYGAEDSERKDGRGT